MTFYQTDNLLFFSELQLFFLVSLFVSPNIPSICFKFSIATTSYAGAIESGDILCAFMDGNNLSALGVNLQYLSGIFLHRIFVSDFRNCNSLRA